MPIVDSDYVITGLEMSDDVTVRFILTHETTGDSFGKYLLRTEFDAMDDNEFDVLTAQWVDARIAKLDTIDTKEADRLVEDATLDKTKKDKKAKKSDS